MKHLITYKLFESIKVPNFHDAEVVSDLEEIFFSELEDNFDAYYKFSPIHENVHKITIDIYKKGGGRYKFTKEIQDYLFRVYQYMREKKWYSNIKYKLSESGPGYSSLEKKIYLRPDGRIRNSDIQWVDEKWPDVINITMEWFSSPNHEYELTLTESRKRNIFQYDKWTQQKYHNYMSIVDEMQSDIETVRDMLLEVSDIGYHTSFDLTPMTKMAVDCSRKNSEKIHEFDDPQIFLIVKQDPVNQQGYKWGGFYGNLGQYRELVDGVIKRILNYLEDKGYKYENHLYKSLPQQKGKLKPSEFEFLNNPASYQMIFSK